MVALSLDNPAVQSYIACTAILTLKVLIMAPMTAVMRITRGVFPNPEDAKIFRGQIKFDDSIVERIRRAHLNDLENIPAFWVLGALYLATSPSMTTATWLFRIFTISRVIHTIVYAVIPMPQPTRAIVFVLAALINFYMGVQVIIYYITAI